jgi:hypothetical protein
MAGDTKKVNSRFFIKGISLLLAMFVIAALKNCNSAKIN